VGRELFLNICKEKKKEKEKSVVGQDLLGLLNMEILTRIRILMITPD
jgi:hypothetical protein